MTAYKTFPSPSTAVYCFNSSLAYINWKKVFLLGKITIWFASPTFLELLDWRTKLWKYVGEESDTAQRRFLE